MSIKPDSIALVRERTDIVNEIGARVQLRKGGANFMGLCPFHGEKSPSFSVSPSKQFYHCFGCGLNGDVFEFLQRHDGMSFTEAVEALAERVGIIIERDDKQQSADDLRRARQRRERAIQLEGICEQAAQAYAGQLHKSQSALLYAKHRGLTEEIIQTYGIGYAPAEGRLFAQLQDTAQRTQLVEAGILAQAEDGRTFERFRERLIFPIRDARSKVVAFGGRWIGNPHEGQEPPAKYLNSPETPIFHKHQVLYGLHEARSHIMRERTAFVVEGYMDVVMLALNGVGNAVAAMGTALTEQQLCLLLRFTDRVCMVFDGDAAGVKAARKSMETALPLLESHQAINFLTLPGDLDPDEFIKAHGRDEFLRLAKAAPTLGQYMLGCLVTEYGAQGKLSTPESKAQFSAALAALLATMRPGNRLRQMIQQEANALLSPPMASSSRPAGAGSAFDRLRQMSQHRTGPANGAAGHSGGAAGGSFAPWRPVPPPPAKHEQSSLWAKLYEAAAAAPAKALAIAPAVLPLLDQESPEERKLAGLLEMLGVNTASAQPESDHPAAQDLLESAPRLIARQRANEVETTLKQMRAAGEISEGDYLREMLALLQDRPA